MSDCIEAMKQALEALEEAANILTSSMFANAAYDLRTAIAQAESRASEAAEKQEPVAWIKRSAKGNIIDLLNEPDEGAEPVYTAPPAPPVQEPVAWEQFYPDMGKPQRRWVELTDEQIKRAKPVCADFVSFRAGVRYAEAKLREKNGG